MQAALKLLRNALRECYVIDWGPLAVVKACRAVSVPYELLSSAKCGRPRKMRLDRLIRFLMTEPIEVIKVQEQSLQLHMQNKNLDPTILENVAKDLQMELEVL